MKIISICNQKGGVGKTTSTLNIGAGLSKLGYKVLLGEFLMTAKKERIDVDLLNWIQDTRKTPEEDNMVRTSEDKKAVKSEGAKIETSEGKKVQKSESEKKDKKSFSIAKGIFEEVKLLAWFMDKSDSAIVEVALQRYLSEHLEYREGISHA
jgi:hypothetical protein